MGIGLEEDRTDTSFTSVSASSCRLYYPSCSHILPLAPQAQRAASLDQLCLFPPMRVLEVQRSRALSLTCEVAFWLTGRCGGMVGDARRAERRAGQVDKVVLSFGHATQKLRMARKKHGRGRGSSGQGKGAQPDKMSPTGASSPCATANSQLPTVQPVTWQPCRQPILATHVFLPSHPTSHPFTAATFPACLRASPTVESTTAPHIQTANGNTSGTFLPQGLEA